MSYGAGDDYLLHNTLSCLVRACVGRVTTVELRNEAHVTGRIVTVDGYMNVTLKDASFVDAARNKRRFEQFFVQNRLIRFVQIPADLNMKKTLEEMFDPEAKKKRQEAMATAAAAAGRGRGANLARRKIESSRQRRREEDLRNALKMKQEQQRQKKN